MELVQKLSVLVLLVFFVVAPVVPTSSLEGLRVDLTHVDAVGNFTKFELIHRAAKRSKHRMSRIISKVTAVSSSADSTQLEVQSPVHAGNGEFLMDLSVGTPTLPFAAILDTGSDLIWTQCKPCVQCFHQPTPIFDPSKSTSYSTISCSSNLCQALPNFACKKSCLYLYSYGDTSSTQGVLATETFTFGSATNPASVPDIAFGCGDTNDGAGFSQGSGLVGLGRGPLSLISQLGLGKFSYCLTSLDNTNKSPLLFGSLAVLKSSSSSAAPSTRLLRNPSQPSFYYLSLKAITVGATTIEDASTIFAMNDDGSGGLIIDSGTSITYLEEAGYKEVKKAFVSQVQLPVADGSGIGLDLCFSLPSLSSSTNIEVPKLIFHFDGADMNLPLENYMVIDSGTGLLCLTMMGSSGMSIFGNFQQQNMQILYDLENDMLSFVPAQCDQL